MKPRQFLVFLLAASTVSAVAQLLAQSSAKPEIVLPPLSTVQPLEVGPPPGPEDEVELSPMPVDYAVEHPLLIGIAVFKVEPAPDRQNDWHDVSSKRFYTWGTRVSTDGTRSGWAVWGYAGMTGNGGGPVDASPIPPDTFARIKLLAATLPDDHGLVPPRNHKVQVEIATRHSTETRMYDAANLPEGLLEIFRLTDSNFTPIVPEFAPDSRSPGPAAHPGLPDTIVLAVSRHRHLTVTLHGSIPEWAQPIDIREAQQIASGRQRPSPGDDLAPWPQVLDAGSHTVFKVPPLPDFSRRSTQFRAAWFTRNDRYLVFSTDIPAIRIYDTNRWQQVDHLPAIPATAIDFEPSPDWKRAVVVFPSGEIDLWDVRHRRSLARIDSGGQLRSATWSPDSRQVAIFTGSGPTSSHLRVWEAATGGLEHELLSFEQARTWVGTPLWWPDGRYLLARTNAMFGPPVIGIWSIQSGRYRGSFTGAECDSGPDPLLWLQDGRLTMDCENQSPITWDAHDAIQAVTAFEDSLRK